MRICISFCGAQGEERAAATLVSSVSCWWMVSEAVEEVGGGDVHCVSHGACHNHDECFARLMGYGVMGYVGK